MSRTNVLTTTTVTYLELIGNGKTYHVPPYQRDYAWTEEEWEDLWNDVLDLRERLGARHDMGALDVRRARDPETDPASVEHILPQNPSGDRAAAFTGTEVQAAVERIGNATLLESAVNHDIGGAPYADKRPACARSACALTRQVAEMAPDVWSFSLVEKRQRHLAQRAVHVWRADFA